MIDLAELTSVCEKCQEVSWGLVCALFGEALTRAVSRSWRNFGLRILRICMIQRYGYQKKHDSNGDTEYLYGVVFNS